MDTQSPPKRMTRARAAAKANEAAGTSTAKTTTAASRAKAAATTTTARTTSAKRKTRADENDDEDEMASAPVTKTARPRGRPKKSVEEPAEAEPKPARRAATSAAGTAARATRATRAKKAAVEPAEQEVEPPKPKRGRPRKIQDNEEPNTAPEPAKTTRTRAAATAKPAAKKTVTFQEPEKENIDPGTANPETKPAAGLRGRPVRRGAAAAPKTTAAATTRATRGTRATRAAGKPAEKMPLSPKKAAQVTARDVNESEDELAGPDKTPLKKKPVRPPPSSTLVQSKSAEAAAAEPTEPQGSPVKDAGESEAPANVLRSPAKRPPPTPFKDAMKSPAKKGEGIQLFPASAAKPATQQPGATPLKTSLLQSPAKRGASAMKAMGASSLARNEPVGSTPLKTSLMQTPARRPGSVLKAFASARQEAPQSPVTRATILSTPGTAAKPSEMLMDQEEAEGPPTQRNLFAEPMPSLKFPGRLSAVLPRDADPAYDLDMATVEEANEDGVELVGETGIQQDAEAEVQQTADVETSKAHAPVDEVPVDEVTVDEAPVDEGGDHEMSDVSDSPEPATEETDTQKPQELVSPAIAAPTSSPTKSLPKFSLRQKDLNPFQGLDEESEDELTSSFQRNYRSPSPVRHAPTPSALPRRVSQGRRASGFGLTPLADKLGAWTAGSPAKESKATNQEDTANETTVSNDEPTVKQSFFDDEMSVREQGDVNAAIMAAIEADIDARMEPVFEGIPVTAEDMELAGEADEMSIAEPEADSQEHDDALSEASQDYGDENQMPAEEVAGPPRTPARAIPMSSHTVSKVPLKSEHTPSPIKTRRHSVSRLPVQRPASVKRSASVISYSPPKKDRSAPTTPSKQEAWSTTGTPSRTPRKDLDAGLLRGAVVFVDVRTSDGGDASEFFVELLAEMGARCVKRWDWSAAEEAGRVGITHVVYKDGGKRTLEKVREARGVVQCVGVSWVLE